MYKNIKLGDRIRITAKFYQPRPFSGTLIAETNDHLLLAFNKEDEYKGTLLDVYNLKAIEIGWKHISNLNSFLNKRYDFFSKKSIEECIKELTDTNIKCRKII